MESPRVFASPARHKATTPPSTFSSRHLPSPTPESIPERGIPNPNPQMSESEIRAPQSLLESSEMAPNSRLPSWILLEEVGYIDDDGDQKILFGRKDDDDVEHSNDVTSAEVRRARISFFAANPPHLSHFSVHGPGPTKNPPLRGRPRVLHLVDNFALISANFSMGGLYKVEYFVYKVVGRGQRPCLEHLEHISDHLHQLPAVCSVGILPLPCDSDGGFAVAALALTGGNQYGLHVFRHKEGAWTGKVHLLERDLVAKIQVINIEKVVVLSSQEIGFVDLWKGVLVFNILQENLLSRFIPLPKFLLGNQSDSQVGRSARRFRDVIISADGLMKCVEVESCWKHILQEVPHPSKNHIGSCEPPVDIWNVEVLHDLEIMPYHPVEDDMEEVEEVYDHHYLGWRAIIWTRDLSSTCWHKKFCFRAQDITYPIPDGMEEFCAHALAPQDLHVSFPTLSVDSNVMYFFSKVQMTDKEFHVAIIDLGDNVLSGFSKGLIERPLFNPSYVSCDIFKYFNADLAAGNNGYVTEAIDTETIYHDVAEVEKGGKDKFCFTSSANKYPPPIYYQCSAPSCFCKPPPQSVMALPLQFGGLPWAGKYNTEQEAGALSNMTCQGLRFGTLDEKDKKEQEVGTSPNTTFQGLYLLGSHVHSHSSYNEANHPGLGVLCRWMVEPGCLGTVLVDQVD